MKEIVLSQKNLLEKEKIKIYEVIEDYQEHSLTIVCEERHIEKLSEIIYNVLPIYVQLIFKPINLEKLI